MVVALTTERRPAVELAGQPQGVDDSRPDQAAVHHPLYAAEPVRGKPPVEGAAAPAGRRLFIERPPALPPGVVSMTRARAIEGRAEAVLALLRDNSRLLHALQGARRDVAWLRIELRQAREVTSHAIIVSERAIEERDLLRGVLAALDPPEERTDDGEGVPW